jgi:hypothetical protein
LRTPPGAAIFVAFRSSQSVELRGLPGKMNLQEVNVFFKISSWSGRSPILLGQRAANLSFIKMWTTEVMKSPFRQFRIMLFSHILQQLPFCHRFLFMKRIEQHRHE